MTLTQKTVLITGGNGFLGTHVCNTLTQRGLTVKELRRSYSQYQPSPEHYRIGTAYKFHTSDFNLTSELQVIDLFRDSLPNIVIHLAAIVGGIGINSKKPGTFYYKNLLMGAFLIEHARLANIEKFVAIGSICAYPKYTPIPFKEENLWNGYPEETNAPYGIAKKAMLVQSQAYRQEFGFNTIYLLPVNLYGPGDNFNPESSHVIPALIKKCIDARETQAASITCWGTGTATREFLYVEDAAEAIILATENYNGPEPINLGTGTEITIYELVKMIAKLTRFTGQIKWDISKPDGQPRRCLDITRAAAFGFKAKTPFEEGLSKTIDWYERTRHASKR